MTGKEKKSHSLPPFSRQCGEQNRPGNQKAKSQPLHSPSHHKHHILQNNGLSFFRFTHSLVRVWIPPGVLAPVLEIPAVILFFLLLQDDCLVQSSSSCQIPSFFSCPFLLFSCSFLLLLSSLSLLNFAMDPGGENTWRSRVLLLSFFLSSFFREQNAPKVLSF